MSKLRSENGSPLLSPLLSQHGLEVTRCNALKLVASHCVHSCCVFIFLPLGKQILGQMRGSLSWAYPVRELNGSNIETLSAGRICQCSRPMNTSA